MSFTTNQNGIYFHIIKVPKLRVHRPEAAKNFKIVLLSFTSRIANCLHSMVMMIKSSLAAAAVAGK